MSAQHIIGIPFQTPSEAEAALRTAMQLQDQKLLRVHDSATVIWDAHGRADVPAAFAGVAGPLQELAKPGQPVLALLVSDLAGMAVIEELRQFRDVRVLYLPC